MWQETIRKRYAHKVNKDEIILKNCPYCSNDKYNLQLNVTKEIFSCWVCGVSGRIEKFFRDQDLEFDKIGWQSSITVEKKAKELLDLSDFTPVNFEKNRVFLVSRGLEPVDVQRYNLLTATSGKYRNKLIIPLKEGDTYAYFVSRDMFAKGKYYNPVINKKSHLLYYLGTEQKRRLYVVEGSFDAISVNKVGFSVAMLLGSSMSNEQLRKIEQIGFTEVVVCLDGDLKKKAMALYEKILGYGLHTRIVLFPGKDDPNELYLEDKEYLKKLLERPKELSASGRVAITLNKYDT